MKILTLTLCLALASLCGYTLGIATAPDNSCVTRYRSQVEVCFTDSECETADADLLDCVSGF